MLSINANEEYLRALHLGQKEKKRLESAGKDPSPAVLDDILPDLSAYPIVVLPTQDIPADRVIGTKTRGRTRVLSASFYPLAKPESEFAAKWTALCNAHLSDEGVSDPIECYEYLGNFYVQEGNKRTSVLKYFGAVRIPAKIKRVMPLDRTDPRVAAYYEFVEFHAATGMYDVQFKKPGEYAELYSALGKKPKEEWTEAEINKFQTLYYFFKETFKGLSEKSPDLSPENALLTFFKVYTYEQACEMSQAELKKALSTLWGDVQASAEPEAITVRTEPADEEKKGVIGKLITGATKHLRVAFIYQQDEKTSAWTSGHFEGAAHLTDALADSVTVKNYFHANSPEAAVELLHQAVADGAELVFATTPPMLKSTLKTALEYPKVRFFNCSASQPLSSVRSYYCRAYEGKFVTGLIAGALAENDLVGYVGSYPILGVPTSINAFAQGVKMTNPRAKILLEWNCVEGDAVKRLKSKGVKVISNRDIPLPDVNYMKHGKYGTFIIDKKGRSQPVASPCWVWSAFYEKITRLVLNGSLDKKDQSEAVNYWWGMDSGAIDVKLSELVPDGLKHLAMLVMQEIKGGKLDPFSFKLLAQDGSVICDGESTLTSMQKLHMDKLADTVVGSIPEYRELLPKSRALVKELGANIVAIPPVTEDEQ